MTKPRPFNAAQPPSVSPKRPPSPTSWWCCADAEFCQAQRLAQARMSGVDDRDYVKKAHLGKPLQS